MTRDEFKQTYLTGKVHRVNKDNCFRLQTIFQEFGILSPVGNGYIEWHDGFTLLKTFPEDEYHSYEYYRKINHYLAHVPVKYQEMMHEYETIRLIEYLEDLS